jgi:anti-sigma regulatory factor (Ser/Thr protein kinase)
MRVAEASQAGEARRIARAFAESLELDATDIAKVAIVVTEAATNLVKHAHGGTILLGALDGDGTRGMSILALDRGPGIANLAECLRDGISTAGSPGTGLGAIRRLSSLFDIYTDAAGTALMATIGPQARGRPAGLLEVGAVCVPIAGEEVSGDGWAVIQGGRHALAVVVDGLGHGPDAARAAVAALAAVRDHPSSTPEEAIDRIHGALRGTRGAAASVAAFDPERRLVRFAGIGNVAGAVISDAGQRSMVSHHGILGQQVRKIQEFSYPWPEGAIVVLHSDGVTSHWDLDAHPGLARRHPMLAAGVLYRDCLRGRDDATVLVVREGA